MGGNARGLGIVGLVVGDVALRNAPGLAQGLLRDVAPFPDLGQSWPEAVAGPGFHRRARARVAQLGEPPSFPDLREPRAEAVTGPRWR